MSKSKGKFSDVKTYSIAKIQPSKTNPRAHPKAQIDLLVKAINKFGFTTPIMIDEAGGIIAGEGRYIAAKKVGLKEVPVIVATGFSTTEKLGYLLADNQLGSLPKYDVAVLGEEMNDLRKLGASMDGLGYDEAAVRFYGAAGGEDEGSADGAAQKLPAGKVWRFGRHTVGLADKATKSNALLMVTAADSAKPIPYKQFIGSIAVVFVRERAVQRAREMLRSGFEIKYAVITPTRPDKSGVGRYEQWHSTGYIGKRTGHEGKEEIADELKLGWLGGRKQTTLWELSDDAPAGTVAAVEVRRRAITNHLPRGGLVFDPADDSGATLLAAQMEGRVADIRVSSKEAAAAVLARLCKRVGKVAVKVLVK